MPARTRKELQDLKAELAATGAEAAAAPKPRHRKATAHPAPETPPAAETTAEAATSPDLAQPEAATLSQLQALVHDLQEALHEATEKAEDAVTTHPTAALASAFLLGVLVGRAWR